MVDYKRAVDLIESGHWQQFLESTSAALQINLVFLVPETGESISVCDECPVCGTRLPSAFEYSEHDCIPIEVPQLKDLFVIVARRYECCPGNDETLAFNNRVAIAKELINNFLAILLDKWSGGQTAIELSTFRHINHIVLSMFRGENKALEKALDLILSAFIILFDADGSWLEYEADGSDGRLLVKGECAVDTGGSGSFDDSIKAEIQSGAVRGRLGIICPYDAGRAETFLQFMVQECMIVFEIDNLIRLTETKLTLILDAIDSIVLLIDRRMNICYANKSAESILGMPRHDMLGSSAAALTAPWNAGLTKGPTAAVKGLKDIISTAKGGIFVDWNVYPIDGSGDIPGWLVIADDRTSFYKLQAIGEQAEKTVGTSTLLSVLAHEIRNPLATFKGLLQLIKLTNDPVTCGKHIDLGIKEIDRVNKLLNDFMHVGEPVDIAAEPIDLKAFMEDMQTLFQSEIFGTEIKIKTDFQWVPLVQIDPSQLAQVIMNLVRNACEAVGNSGEIYLGLRETDRGRIQITVRDTGSGLAPDIMDKLFKPFYTTKIGGTGLGLSICQAIMHNHGGEITARNVPGGGAEFAVILPAKTYASVKLNKYDVLVVTGEEMMRLPIEHVLRAEDINVVTVNSLETALEILQEASPHAMVLDAAIAHPKDFGRIKTMYPNLHVVVACDDGDEAIGYCDDFCCITKPLNYAGLINKIREK